MLPLGPKYRQQRQQHQAGRIGGVPGGEALKLLFWHACGGQRVPQFGTRLPPGHEVRPGVTGYQPHPGPAPWDFDEVDHQDIRENHQQKDSRHAEYNPAVRVPAQGHHLPDRQARAAHADERRQPDRDIQIPSGQHRSHGPAGEDEPAPGNRLQHPQQPLLPAPGGQQHGPGGGKSQRRRILPEPRQQPPRRIVRVIQGQGDGVIRKAAHRQHDQQNRRRCQQHPLGGQRIDVVHHSTSRIMAAISAIRSSPWGITPIWSAKPWPSPR